MSGDEEMEDQVETEQDSTSHVAMLAGRGTFIAGTADGLGTVTQARHSAKRHRAAVNVSEDLFNRLIQDYGLVSPERPNGPKMLCGSSSRNSVPRSSMVKMPFSSWRSKPSPRSAWRTSSAVGIAQ